MSAKFQAIDAYLPELKASVEELVTVISKECHTKGLLNSDVFSTLRKSGISREEKTKLLIAQVQKQMKKDEQNCETFIKILARHKSCHDLVQKIRQEVKEIKNRAIVEQVADQASGKMQSPSKRTKGSTKALQCTEKGIRNAINPATKRKTQLCNGSQGHYNTKMELAQQEAKLNDAQDKISKLEVAKRKAESERDKMKRECSMLEAKFKLKDKELDQLNTELDDLNYTNDLLRRKASRLERNKHVNQTMVNRKMAEDREKIRKLESEKQELKLKLDDACNKECKKNCEMKQIQSKIEALKSELENLKSDKQTPIACQSEARPVPCHRCSIISLVIIVTLISSIIIFYVTTS